MSSVGDEDYDSDDDFSSEGECAAILLARMTGRFFISRRGPGLDLSTILRQLQSVPVVRLVSFHRVPSSVFQPCLQTLKQYVRSNEQLEALQLRDTFLGNETIADLMQALFRHSTLKVLDLEGNALVGCGEMLRDLVRRNKSILLLDLCDNDLGTSIPFLAQGLRNNTTLTIICLSSCKLIDSHLEPLCAAMDAGQCPVTELDVRDNYLTIQSVNRLVAAIQKHNILKSLVLSHNLNIMNRPQALDLQDDEVDENANPWDLFVAFLRDADASVSLKQLDLHACTLSEPFLVEFWQALETNGCVTGVHVDVGELGGITQLIASIPQMSALQYLLICDHATESLDDIETSLQTAVLQNKSLLNMRYVHHFDGMLSQRTRRIVDCSMGRNVMDSFMQPASDTPLALWSHILEQLWSDYVEEFWPEAGPSMAYYALRTQLDLVTQRRPSQKRSRPTPDVPNE